jgi:threonine aldolase
VFCKLPNDTAKRIRAAGHTIYDWTTPGEVRFVTSWDNTDADINGLLKLISNTGSM